MVEDNLYYRLRPNGSLYRECCICNSIRVDKRRGKIRKGPYKRKDYTDFEDRLIQYGVQINLTDKELGAILNRPYQGVKGRRLFLFIKRPPYSPPRKSGLTDTIITRWKDEAKAFTMKEILLAKDEMAKAKPYKRGSLKW